MTVLEQRFMERVPSLLNEVCNELMALRKEVAALREELKKKEED